MKKVLGKRVLVLMDLPEDMSKGGLLLKTEPPKEGTIVKVGEVEKVKKGDRVLVISPSRGIDLMHDSVPHKIFHIEELIGVL